MPKVLVVEDEHSQAEVLTMLLQTEGFETVVAINGQDALNQLDRVLPDLIITDYMMPYMNGGQLAQCVRANAAHGKIPIVMTSATDERQVESHAAYYDAFHRKPYRWIELLGTIRKLLPMPGPL